MAKLKYKDKDGFWQELPVGTNVVANPTLTGTEQELTSLQVGNAKYKSGGGKIYKHTIKLFHNHDNTTDTMEYVEYRSDNTKITDPSYLSGKWCYLEFNNADGTTSKGIGKVELAYDTTFGITGVVGTSESMASAIYGTYSFEDIEDTVTQM